MARRLPPWSLAVVLAAAYVLLAPTSADLAAQTYRADLWADHGWLIWDNGWYAGHHLPAYSVLYPPLGALLGPRGTGALAVVAAAWCFWRLVAPRGQAPSPAARPAAWWFAATTGSLLLTGRVTFALGVALALAALWGARAGRGGAAAALAVLTGLGSPVAAAFLALALAAWWLRAPRHPVPVALAAAALAPVVALTLAFPEGGDFPFAPSAFWPILAATLLLLAALRDRPGPLRTGVALSAVLLVLAFAVPSAMGGNATRLGALFAGPVAALALWEHRRRTVLLLAPALLYWTWSTPVDDQLRTRGDDSVRVAYHAGVRAFLAGEAARAGPFRVEVPFTRNHWETTYLARRVPLARGWERQLDRRVNPLFYGGRLTPERWHAWLRTWGVRYVALPDAPLDPSGEAEAALARAGQPFLEPVWRDAHWRVWAVTDAPGLGIGGTVTALTADAFAVRADRPGGTVIVRVRPTPYWTLGTGRGCVEAVRPDDAQRAMTRVRLAPGTTEARVEARFAPGRIRASGPRCA